MCISVVCIAFSVDEVGLCLKTKNITVVLLLKQKMQAGRSLSTSSKCKLGVQTSNPTGNFELSAATQNGSEKVELADFRSVCFLTAVVAFWFQEY